MANQVYNSFKMHLLSGDVNLETANIWMALTSGTYTFSQTHEVIGDISEEIISAGYDVGGQLIPSTSLTTGTTTTEGQLTGHGMTYSGLTSIVEFGIIWVSGGTDTTNYLLGQVDFGSQTLTSSDLVITWNTDGIYNLT